MYCADDELKGVTASQHGPRSNRVRGPSKQRFEVIFQEGRRESGPFLRVICLPGEGLVGSTTVKSIGSKPMRNRQRRRIRNAVRRVIGNAPKPYDWIVIGKQSIVAATLEKVEQELAVHVQKLMQRWDEMPHSG